MISLIDFSILPQHWEIKKIEDIFCVIGGGTPSKKVEEFWHGNIPWISSSDIKNNRIVSSKRINAKAVRSSSTNIVPKNSVIVVTRVGLGKVAISNKRICFSQDCQALIDKDSKTHPYYTLYYFSYAGQIFKVNNQGTTISGITKKQLKQFLIPLPPLDEQKRIVAKIESLLSELDRSIEGLKRAKEKLKRYRQAVLKAAFEGKLTEVWRKAHAHELEDAQTLLERIKQERQAAYEAKLAEWEAEVKAWEEGGKVGKKPTKPRKYSITPSIEDEQKEKLPKLPDTWTWIHFGEIFSVYVGATPSRKNAAYWDGDIHWVSSGEVAFSEIWDTKEKITKEGFENTSTELHPPGTVMLGMIGEGKTRGQAAILRINAAHNQNTAAIRLEHINFDSKFLYYLLMFNYEKTRKLGSGNNQKALNKTRVELMIYPLCSVNEQNQIVKIVESLFNEADKMGKIIDTSLKKAESLRQSILKSAFEGRLVSHKTENTSLFNSPSKPLNIEGISPTDLHAGIIALSYKMHQDGGYLDKLNHVKHEKIAHMVESVVGIDLGRAPVQDAAGPADFHHLKKVEHRAQKANWFTTEKEKIGYRYKPLPGFDQCVARTKEALGEHLETVERLIKLMLPMSMDSAEIFATTYAAWNNMLMDGLTPTDEEIVSKAREEWSARKLTLERERFFKALEWMRQKGIVPCGTGKYVKKSKNRRLG